jgi:hypothetical protein
VLHAFTDTLNEVHGNPLIAKWALDLVSGQDCETATGPIDDGPLPDRIAFRYEGVIYDAGLKPIVWRFLRALFWRLGEHVNARDIYKQIWLEDVPENAWRQSPETVLTEKQAKDVVTKSNSFLRRIGPAPYHASQNALTGVRVFALLEGAPRLSKRSSKTQHPKA